MLKVGVVGANGFIGSRLVEQWHLEERAEVVPVFRRPAAAASALRFGLDCRIADASREHELARAFVGCHAVVHAAAGDRRFVTESPGCVVRAAARAGVGTVVYLSSMAVHGWRGRPGTDETSPLPRRHAIPYNGWKVSAEGVLRSACAETGTGFVILRPGIVYGPRSQWIDGFARGLLDGTAHVVAGGRGICNAIYVDNLVNAIGLALEQSEASGETLLISDAEVVTWRMLYEPLCRALGRSWDVVADLAPRAPRATAAERMRGLRHRPAARVVLDRIPGTFRERVRRLAADRLRTESSQDEPRPPALEMSILQTCDYRFPTSRAQRVLGFEPPVTFEEACRRTIAWLGFAGYELASGIRSTG